MNADSGDPSVVKDQVIGANNSDPSDVCGADSKKVELAFEPSECIEQQSSELMTDLTRTWDYEESGHMSKVG